MLTRGIIEQIIDDYSARVRIPFFNKAKNATGSTPTASLNIARFSTPSVVRPKYKIGDAVFVGFEDNDFGKPVILGNLFCENTPKYSGDVYAGNLHTQNVSDLSANTTIGEVTSVQTGYLKGLTANIQDQINVLNKRTNQLLYEQVDINATTTPDMIGNYEGQFCVTYYITEATEQESAKEVFKGLFIWTRFGWVTISSTVPEPV